MKNKTSALFKKSLFALSVSLFSCSAFAAKFSKTCEDVGMKTEVLQLEILTSFGAVKVGEEQEFCTLERDNMRSTILASSLLSEMPNLAATAYRNGPKPVLDKSKNSDHRIDRTYCLSLGGAYRLGGRGLSGGWSSKDPTSGESGMCVFADGSMIATWTLAYKRHEPASTGRPDLEPFFQNNLIPGNLW